jgi:hypothetical protein
VAGEPDFASISSKLDDVASRVTALEGHRRQDALDRQQSQARIENQLSALTDDRDPKSLVSKVDEMRDAFNQMRGVFALFKWLGSTLTIAIIGILAWIVIHTSGVTL